MNLQISPLFFVCCCFFKETVHSKFVLRILPAYFWRKKTNSYTSNFIDNCCLSQSRDVNQLKKTWYNVSFEFCKSLKGNCELTIAVQTFIILFIYITHILSSNSLKKQRSHARRRLLLTVMSP